MTGNNLIVRHCTISEMEAAPNIMELLEEYAAESSISGLPHPSAKVDMYKHLEIMGEIYPIGAFLGDMLIGFITVLAPVLPHYSARVAVAESFFVSKEYRSSGAGLKLLHAAQNRTKEANACGLLVSAPLGGDLAEVLPHVGYTETNRVFFRSFGNE